MPVGSRRSIEGNQRSDEHVRRRPAAAVHATGLRAFPLRPVAVSGASAEPGLALGEALTSRIAHDIGGSLQALTAASEVLAAQDVSLREEAAGLVAEAVRRLRGRLSLLRAAWGRGGAPLSLEAVVGLVTEGVGPPPVAIDTSRLEDGGWAFPGYDRLLLNALLVSAEGLPRGGAVLCAGTTGGEIALGITGEGADWPSGLAAIAAGEDPFRLVEPRRIAVPMLALLARRFGVALRLLMGGAPPLLLLEPPRPS